MMINKIKENSSIIIIVLLLTLNILTLYGIVTLKAEIDYVYHATDSVNDKTDSINDMLKDSLDQLQDINRTLDYTFNR